MNIICMLTRHDPEYLPDKDGNYVGFLWAAWRCRRCGHYEPGIPKPSWDGFNLHTGRPYGAMNMPKGKVAE